MSIKQNAIDNERKTAYELDMEETKASGAMVTDKGDMVSEKFRLESKQTVKKSISIKRDWLYKIKQEADDDNKFWALYTCFVDDDNEKIIDGVMISPWLFKQLRKHMGEEIYEF